MTDDAVRRELDGRAACVADWLRERLAERPVWLSGELHGRAAADGIELPFWLKHPTVQAVGMVRRSVWGEMAPDGVWCYVRPEGWAGPMAPPFLPAEAVAMDDFVVS